MEAPLDKLKGAAKKADYGMVQLLFATIVESAPLQFVGSASNPPSAFLKRML